MTCKNNINPNFSSILKSIQPSKLGHKNFIDMIFKKGQKYKKTLNNIWLLGPDHKNFMNMVCKYNINDNFFPILYEKRLIIIFLLL